MSDPAEALLARELALTHWHMVAHRSEVVADRDYVRLSWPLGELVVCNDNGATLVFDNVCPHRGTRFFVEDAGNSPISCPYHGWTYRGGKLHIPRRETYVTGDVERAHINSYLAEWCGDFLFVAAKPRTDVRTQLGELYATIEEISRDIVRRHDFNTSDWECDWRIAIENALEPDHVPLIHTQSLGLLGLNKGVNTFVASNSIWRADVTSGRTARSLKALRRLFDIGYQYEGYMSIFLFPFTFLSSTFGYSYSLQNFFPAPDRRATHFSSRLLVSRSSPAAGASALAAFFDSVAKVNRRVFEEDYGICRRVSPAYKIDMPGQIFSSAEEKVGHFRSSIRARA
jgi:phenylpropionate dioxygenase-like ring-hydroxylating dioxygenase large terminal subunit